MSSKINLSDIRFSYDDHEVIGGLSLSVNDGEIVGILGPNGAGKSTLIKIMAGILRPSRGSIEMDGTDLCSISHSGRARKIAFVPQESHIPFSFTSLEVVLMGRAPYIKRFGFETKRDIETALEVMTKTDCREFLNRDINNLSGGERQRVLLARALAQEPQVLLLDEPTSFLDIKHSGEFVKLLKTLNTDHNLTIVCAMHDLNLASSLCKHVVFLKGGLIISQGNPNEMFSPEIIRSVYNTEVHVGFDTTMGMNYCLPL